jgi:Reverse transcriptase (RNA-dependent DNA polymerase)
LAKQTIKPLYFVFLDLKKADDALDRDRTINILEGYGTDPNILCLIKNVWMMDTVLQKQARFYGKSFNVSWGVRQGDIISPTIFNVVADTVIRDCKRTFCRGNIL